MKSSKFFMLSALLFMCSIAVSQYKNQFSTNGFQYSTYCEKNPHGGECKLMISKITSPMKDVTNSPFIFQNTDRLICSITNPYNTNTNGSLICITAKDYLKNGPAGQRIGCAAWRISNGSKILLTLNELKGISDKPQSMYDAFYEEFNGPTTTAKQEFVCASNLDSFSLSFIRNYAPMKETKGKPTF